MRRWTNGLPGATARLGANLALRGLSVSQCRMRADTHPGPEHQCSTQRSDTLMQLSRSTAQHSALRRTAGPYKLAQIARGCFAARQKHSESGQGVSGEIDPLQTQAARHHCDATWVPSTLGTRTGALQRHSGRPAFRRASAYFAGCSKGENDPEPTSREFAMTSISCGPRAMEISDV